MLSLFALSLALTSSTALDEKKTEDSFQEICREAIDWTSMSGGDTKNEYLMVREGEAYVGRLQIAMDKRRLDQDDRIIADAMCRMYVSGAGDQLNWISEQLAKEPSKLAVGPAGG